VCLRGDRGWALRAGVCCFGAALALAAPARAEAEEGQVFMVLPPAPAAPSERSGFSFDLRLGAGAATAQFTEGDRDVAAFPALAIGGALRFGWFLDRHVLVGAEVASSWHTGVGHLTVQDLDYFNGDALPSDATYTAVAPLGVFIEVYPWERQGFFISVAGGVGGLALPSFSDTDAGPLMAGYSLELGYELSRETKVGPAPFIRYSRWAGEEFFEEHPDGLVSRELLVGLRWSFWSPAWQ
jgi:hypothetical protein